MLLILTLYLILLFKWYRFRHLIKIMADVAEILNDDEFFGDVFDTPKEGIEQHKKRECLKSVIYKVKLGHKWTHERVDKASDETINKKHAAYRQRELKEKEEKRERPWGGMSLVYTLAEFLGWLKSGMFTNYANTLRMIRSLRTRLLA